MAQKKAKRPQCSMCWGSATIYAYDALRGVHNKVPCPMQCPPFVSKCVQEVLSCS